MLLKKDINAPKVLWKIKLTKKKSTKFHVNSHLIIYFENLSYRQHTLSVTQMNQ